jgi:APA family basic amino acid/polyamine antiporter
MVGLLFSADAWANVTFTAAEARNPRRNLPLSFGAGHRAGDGSVHPANVAYLAALPSAPELDARVRALEQGAAEHRAAGREEAARSDDAEKKSLLERASTLDRGIAHARDDRVGTAVMELAFPGLGVQLMALAIMLSTFGCVNGLIRWALAIRDGPRRAVLRACRSVEPSRRSAWGLILQGAWAARDLSDLGQLLDYVIFAAPFYVLTVIGLFVLRRTRPDAERPYRAFGYPVVPALYVVLCAAIMLDLLVVKPLYTWPGLGIVLTGVPVYFLWRRSRRGG